VTATDSLDTIADRFGTTLAGVVAGANASRLLLRAGAPVTFGLTTQTRPGETLTQLAQRFDVDKADAATALGDQIGLLAPGATLTISAQGSYVIKQGDTLTSIAASFGTNAEAITTANPAVNCQPGQPCWSPVAGASLPRPGMGISMPVGLRVNLPVPLHYQVGSQDTLAGIAARFGLGVADLVPAVADATLAAQVTVVLPPVSYLVKVNDTPLSIAAIFGLTASQLVLANTGARFGTVVVPGAELLPLDALVAGLAQAGRLDSPGSSLARFLLHGLRLPSPDEVPPDEVPPASAALASQRLYPMYTLTGQQVTPPDPLPGDYGLTLAANTASPRPAVTFAGGAGPLTVPLSARDRDTLARIAGQLAQSPPIDAGVLAATRYPPYATTPRQYALGKPVSWQAASQPPLRYAPPGASAPPAAAPGTPPAAGQPTLLPFPDALRNQVAASADADPQTGTGLRVGLASGSKTTPAAATRTTAIYGFGWATRADFGLRRMPDPNAPGQPLAHVYEVFGVSQDATADLRQLLGYARGKGAGDQLQLALLYPLGAASAAGPGLRSDPVDTAGVLLVKANMSTRSSPPLTGSAEPRAPAAAQDGAAVTAATMADARDFLTLLWEATVTNTGGYYLFYRVGQDGPGLPAGIFGTDPTATVSLLVTAFPAAGGGSTIPLRAFHNTALVTDNLPDPNAAVFVVPPQLPLPPGTATLAGLAGSLETPVESLGAANATTANLLVAGQTIAMPGGATYRVQPGDDILSAALALGVDAGPVVQAIKDGPEYLTPGALFEIYPEWLTVRGTLRPGAAGFRLVRADPDPAGGDPETPRPAHSTAQDPKTQLEVLFNLVGYQLLGTGGFRPSADGLPAGPARQASGPLNHQLTAVGGFEPWIYAKQLRIDKFATSAPVAALDGQQDPYAGVGGQASFGWQPQDVFGNRLLAQQSIEVGVGYADELVALSQWPSMVTGYQFTGQPGAAAVQVGIALDAGAYVPAPGEVFAPVTADGTASPPTGIAAQASAHRDRYLSVFWQLSHDLAAEVTTTVDEQAPHPIDVAGLAAFASGAYGYLATVAGSVQLTTTVPPGGTLQSIADTYQVSPAELAQANRSAAQSFAASSLLVVTKLTVENRCPVIENDTLAGIVQRSPAPVPADAGALAAANPALDLTPGAQLAIPARGTLPTATYQAKAGDTLASVAASFGLTAADVGAANAQVPGLLAAEQSVLLGTGAYTGPDDTFASIAAGAGVTVDSLATANASTPGLLVAGQTIAIPRHVVLPGTGTHRAGTGDTLGAIAQRGGVQVTALGSANSDVTGLLASGAQLRYLGYSTVTVSNDTLSTVALRLQAMLTAGDVAQQVTVALLAEANAAVPCLAAGAALLVPPADVTSGAPVAASNPAAVFPLQTAVTLRRTGHVDPALAAAGAQDVNSVTTPLAPAVPEGAAGQTLALQQFAAAFETAFAAPQLKLTTTGSGSSGTQTQQLFAVQYGTAVLNYEIGGDTPYFFAPRPLSTALWNSPGPIPIRGYARGQPLGAAQPTSFTGADLDGWAQAFLAELDLVLSGNYAVAAYALDPAGYAALVRAKNTIAGAIRDSVDTVTEPGGGPGPDLASARDALYQRLLITLSTAYQVDTIVQFPVAVTAPADWAGDTAPRLRGQPLADTYTVAAGATLRSVASDGSFQAPLDLLVTSLADSAFLLAPGFEVPGQGALPAYTVAGGDTLASVAAHFAVPVTQLGDALADSSGLLLPGAAVNLVRRTYPLADDDTLFTAVSYLALDVATPAAQAAAVDNFAAMNATLPDLFADGTTLLVPLPATVAPGDTISGLAAAHGLTSFGLTTSIAARTDVLTPGASVTLAGQAVTIRPGDSLDSIAAAAGLPLDAVTSAVRDTAGLLVSGVVIALPGSQVSYAVRSGDTLATIAAAIGQGATPSWIVTTQLDTTQALRAGTVVAYLSRVAGFSLSDANISLAGSSPGSLTFLFRTASNTTFSNLALRLRYQVNQLEYGIEDVPWARGYQSSQWLTFLLPPPDAAIGTVDVPIPLRAHPVPPSVTSQRTIPFTGPLTLQELRRYDYDYSFSAQRAAQDTVSTSQLQNTVLAGGTTAASTSTAALPGTLAQYASVRAGLEQDLALLTRVDQVVPAAAGTTAGGAPLPPPPAQQALQVFTELAGSIAQAWAAWPAPPPASPPAPSPAVGAVPRYAPRYQVRRGTLATGEATVQLRPVGEAAAMHAGDLVLGLRGHAAADASGDAAPGDRGYAGRRQVAFTRLALPADAPAPSSPGADEFDLLVPDRDVVTTQNIWGEVSVTRNASLLAGRPTNPAFIYAVPDVKAATPAVPLISWTGQFDLTSVPFDPPSAPPGTGPLAGEGPVTGARPLADWLINFFDALLNRYAVLGGDTLAKIAMRYDLTLAALAPAVADVPGLLAAGTELPLPSGGYHQVAGGDTLAGVAAASSVQVTDLVQAAGGAEELLVPGVLVRPAAVSRTLRVAVDYGFPLATAAAARPGQKTEIVSRLPVLLRPAFLFDSATDLQPGSGFCAALAQQLSGWAAARGLPDNAGRWMLDVSLYTTLPAAPGAPAAQAPPLLELTDVRLDRRLVQHNPRPALMDM
jgi:LysM repeat protein